MFFHFSGAHSAQRRNGHSSGAQRRNGQSLCTAHGARSHAAPGGVGWDENHGELWKMTLVDDS